MTIARQIAAFCHSSATAALPEDAEERARLCVADHLHAAMHGMRSETGRRMMRYAGLPAVPDGERPARLLCSVAAVHEIDDVHQDTSMHPGAVIVAAALAAATESRISGRVLLRAVASGYEVGIRLSI